MTQMNIDYDVLAKCDASRLLELMTIFRLPISQAFAYHLCVDKDWQNRDAAALLGISAIAISDAKIKALNKMQKVGV